MDWLEVTIDTSPDMLGDLTSRLEDLGVGGLVINDEAAIREFLDNNPKAWDYIEDEVFSKLHGNTSVQFYLEDNAEGEQQLTVFRAALPETRFKVKRVCDEDWLNNWKNFFKPLEIGARLLIIPGWEPVPEKTDRIILRIEPKLVFGTGSHASTRMCLEELENHRAQNVLDLGCGSGILAVAALLFGAENAVGCDIAADAASVCRENALLNGIDVGRFKTFIGDILNGKTLWDFAGGKKYDIIFANIIADVIIPISQYIPGLLAQGGVFICSGIIDGRQSEVKAALTENGLKVIHARQMDNWHMFAAEAIV